MPALNEALGIEATLQSLQPLRAGGVEVIVVDGGSIDDTIRLAAPLADQVATAPRGRASQMNAGAAAARGETLLFLHADTTLPDGADRLALQALVQSGRLWGRFDARLTPVQPLTAVVGWAMNLRSRLSGIATGDQAIFVRRAAFDRVGGYPDIPLMEDIAISRALRRLSPPACLKAQVQTSARQWRARGVVRTVLLMWRLRLAYFLGADPHRLARRYGYVPREG
jgi:rSAM/selenodomain-associated transferase 2